VVITRIIWLLDSLLCVCAFSRVLLILTTVVSSRLRSGQVIDLVLLGFFKVFMVILKAKFPFVFALESNKITY
jgi:hypothetical protein